MKHYFLSLGAILLLVGAGCASEPATDTTTTNTSPPAKDAGEQMELSDDNMIDDYSMMAKGDITLTAEERENGEVYFAWNVPAGTEYDGFILVRGEKANPENDGKNYWFRQHYTRRATTWAELPKGDWHVRICGLQEDECTVYSNDVMVSVE